MTRSNHANLKQIDLDILPYDKTATGPQFLLHLNSVTNPNLRLFSDVAHTWKIQSAIFLEY